LDLAALMTSTKQAHSVVSAFSGPKSGKRIKYSMEVRQFYGEARMKFNYAKVFESSLYLVVLVAILLSACGGSSGGGSGGGGGTSPGDSTAPIVTATTPIVGASGVGVHAILTAMFSEALNASTVSDTSFTLLNGASSVSGSVGYSGTTATFTPTNQLAYSTAYTATLTTGVKDVAGNALASNYTLSFTTQVPPINDSGIRATQCYEAGSSVLVSCASVNAIALNPAQDGMLGRDVTSNSDTDGILGFSFTKIDATGAALPPSASNWSCVKDNVTGLTWEGKTVDGGLRDRTKTYNNYDSTTALQMNSGTVAPLQGEIDAATNSVGFKNAVNSAGLCGASDWRLPTADELQSIVNYSVATPGPTLDADWFQYTPGNVYWTSSPYVVDPTYAWSVGFLEGYVFNSDRSFALYVRLVRADR
jgi:hypothetical protein